MDDLYITSRDEEYRCLIGNNEKYPVTIRNINFRTVNEAINEAPIADKGNIWIHACLQNEELKNRLLSTDSRKLFVIISHDNFERDYCLESVRDYLRMNNKFKRCNDEIRMIMSDSRDIIDSLTISHNLIAIKQANEIDQLFAQDYFDFFDRIDSLTSMMNFLKNRIIELGSRNLEHERIQRFVDGNNNYYA